MTPASTRTIEGPAQQSPGCGDWQIMRRTLQRADLDDPRHPKFLPFKKARPVQRRHSGPRCLSPDNPPGPGKRRTRQARQTAYPPAPRQPAYPPGPRQQSFCMQWCLCLDPGVCAGASLHTYRHVAREDRRIRCAAVTGDGKQETESRGGPGETGERRAQGQRGGGLGVRQGARHHGSERTGNDGTRLEPGGCATGSKDDVSPNPRMRSKPAMRRRRPHAGRPPAPRPSRQLTAPARAGLPSVRLCLARQACGRAPASGCPSSGFASPGLREGSPGPAALRQALPRRAGLREGSPGRFPFVRLCLAGPACGRAPRARLPFVRLCLAGQPGRRFPRAGRAAGRPSLAGPARGGSPAPPAWRPWPSAWASACLRAAERRARRAPRAPSRPAGPPGPARTSRSSSPLTTDRCPARPHCAWRTRTRPWCVPARSGGPAAAPRSP